MGDPSGQTGVMSGVEDGGGDDLCRIAAIHQTHGPHQCLNDQRDRQRVPL